MKHFIILIFVSSCIHKMEKPFIITSKGINHGDYKNECFYQYEDKNGREGSFRETNDKYQIGDIIK